MDADAAMKGDSTMAGDSNPGDSGGDATMNDAADANDSAMANDATDGSAACPVDNTKCNAPGTAGLCKAGACSDCVSVTDDAHCMTAYGSASSPYLCLAGACTAGDCRANADCAANPNGRLCGASTPHHCGKCTTDEQCAGNAGGAVCNTSTGQCVAGTCTGVAAGGAPGTCAINASDICCTGTCQSGAGANACCPGANALAYCAGKIGDPHAACVNNVCTACPVPIAATYLVDPVGGSDVGGTGDHTTAGCAFKTITRALQVIGTSPLVATSITVLGPSTVRAGETFPIPLPANVTVTTTGGPVHVDVPAGSSGFALSEVGSGIAGGAVADGGAAPVLTIGGPHGGANDATSGIVVDTGTGVSSANAPRISNLIVTNFLEDGILVQNTGILTVGAGVTSTLNGTPTAAGRRAGLHVTGNGQAIVDVAAGAAPAHFDANTNHGIRVDTSGTVTVMGTVTSAPAGTGTVTTNGNYAAGVWIQQTAATPPASAITGLVSFANTNGNGIRIFAGSSVRIRASVSLGNQGDGVLVSAAAGGSNDISNIDLGRAVDAGGTFGANTFQEPLGSGNNGAAGICLQVRNNAGTLHAEGNVFGAIHCATGAGALTTNNGACDNAACAAGVCDLGITNATGNAVDVSMCSP